MIKKIVIPYLFLLIFMVFSGCGDKAVEKETGFLTFQLNKQGFDFVSIEMMIKEIALEDVNGRKIVIHRDYAVDLAKLDEGLHAIFNNKSVPVGHYVKLDMLLVFPDDYRVQFHHPSSDAILSEPLLSPMTKPFGIENPEFTLSLPFLNHSGLVITPGEHKSILSFWDLNSLIATYYDDFTFSASLIPDAIILNVVNGAIEAAITEGDMGSVANNEESFVKSGQEESDNGDNNTDDMNVEDYAQAPDGYKKSLLYGNYYSDINQNMRESLAEATHDLPDFVAFWVSIKDGYSYSKTEFLVSNKDEWEEGYYRIDGFVPKPGCVADCKYIRADMARITLLESEDTPYFWWAFWLNQKESGPLLAYGFQFKESGKGIIFDSEQSIKHSTMKSNSDTDKVTSCKEVNFEYKGDPEYPAIITDRVDEKNESRHDVTYLYGAEDVIRFSQKNSVSSILLYDIVITGTEIDTCTYDVTLITMTLIDQHTFDIFNEKRASYEKYLKAVQTDAILIGVGLVAMGALAGIGIGAAGHLLDQHIIKQSKKSLADLSYDESNIVKKYKQITNSQSVDVSLSDMENELDSIRKRMSDTGETVSDQDRKLVSQLEADPDYQKYKLAMAADLIVSEDAKSDAIKKAVDRITAAFPSMSQDAKDKIKAVKTIPELQKHLKTFKTEDKRQLFDIIADDDVDGDTKKVLKLATYTNEQINGEITKGFNMTVSSEKNNANAISIEYKDMSVGKESFKSMVNKVTSPFRKTPVFEVNNSNTRVKYNRTQGGRR